MTASVHVCVCVCVRQCNTCTWFGAVLSAMYRLFACSYGFVAEMFKRRTCAQARTHTHTHTCLLHSGLERRTSYIGPKCFDLFLLLLRHLKQVRFVIYQLPYHSVSSSTTMHHGLLFREVMKSGRYVRMFRRDLCFQGSFGSNRFLRSFHANLPVYTASYNRRLQF
jgi:hypothetical protein